MIPLTKPGVCTIYKITNKINGKAYIGQTWQGMQVRWKFHTYKSSKCGHISRAIQKYGPEAFSIEAVCYAVDQRDADFWESHFIDRNLTRDPDKGYNLANGGQGVRGLKHSDETKRKMSAARTGRKHTPETLAKLRAIQATRKPASESTRRKIAAGRRGVKASADTRAKMSASRLAYVQKQKKDES